MLELPGPCLPAWVLLSQVSPVGSDESVSSAPFPLVRLEDAAFVREGANLVPQIVYISC